jgi:hypothetical protein
VPNPISGTVSVLLGDGHGGFGVPTSYPAGTEPDSVAVGDFNHDGNLDLAVANDYSSNVSVLLGDGHGGFGAPISYPAGVNPQSVVVGDFNRDGNLDLAVANISFDTHAVSVLLGDGHGGFAAPTSYPVGSAPVSVAVGDFNRDGAPDLAVANALDNTVSVLLNQLTGFAARAGFGLDDVGNAVAADAAGDVYVAGNVQHTSPAAAPFGAFVSKYAPDGTAQWTQNIFGDVTDTASGIAVDPAGNAFVTGSFRGVTNFGPGFVITPSSVTSYNGFIEKLNPNGIVQWVREIDAPLAAGGDAVALDAFDNVYTTGSLFGSARFFGPGGLLITNPSMTNQGTSFLVKQDSFGNLLWVQQFGIPDPTLSGGDLSSANAIAVNHAGTALYVAGGFRGHNVRFGTTFLSVPGPDGPPGPTNSFVEKFDALGNSLWAVRAGSATVLQGEAEAAHGIALDQATGKVYVTGSFDNTADFVSANGGPVLHLTGPNGPNTYVARLEGNGTFVNAVRFADNGDEVGTAVAVDQAHHVYVTGWFSLTAQLGPFQLQSRGDLDVYVAKLDAGLNVLAARQLGGTGRDRGLGIAVDDGGYVDLTGSFTGTGTFSFPPNAPVVLTSAGGTDVFVSHQRLVSSPVRVTVLDGHILRLLGDDTASRIDLTDDGLGTIQVLLDDDALRVYSGIDRIEVLTAGGDDVVRYQIGDPDLIGPPSLRPADLMVDLGNGDDTLVVDAARGWSGPSPWHIAVAGGRVEHANFAFADGSAGLDLEDRLASQTSTIDLRINATAAAAAPGARWNIRFFSEGGTDTVASFCDGASVGHKHFNTALALSLIGDGNDTLNATYRNVEIDAAQSLFCPDDNTFAMTFQNVLVNARLEVRFTGGSGPGGPGSTVEFNNTEPMPVPLDGSLVMTAHSGPVEDAIRVVFDFRPVSPSPGMPQDFHGDVAFHVPHGDSWSVLFDIYPAGS